METRNQNSFFIGDWQVSVPENRLGRGDDVEHLEPKAMEVLAYLASRQGEVVSREDLERVVWRGAVVGYDAVTGTVIKLRKALGDDPRQPRFIATIPKRGYQLIAPVSVTGAGGGSASPPPASSPVAADLPARGKPHRETPRARRWAVPLALAAGLIALVLGLWTSGPQPPEPGPSTVSSAGSSPAIPSVVVLPFRNHSQDPRHQDLADGMTEDVITDLSRSSGLLVLASNTSFAYRDSQASPEEVGKELGVDFVLQGSIRPVGDTLRVNTQLVDTKTGFNRWAERYDRKLEDLFAVQDEMTHALVTALAIELTDLEKERLARRATANIRAYDFFLEGQRLSREQLKEANRQAQDAYRNAIEVDPAYGRAYGALAYTLAVDFRRGWSETPAETIDRALELARNGVALDDSIPQTYWSLGYVHLMRQEFEQAEEAVARAIEIAPNYADGYGLLALLSNNLGKPEQAIELIIKGMRLNPFHTWDYPYNLGRAYYTLGRLDEAIAALEEAHQRSPTAIPVIIHLAASYAAAGRQTDAEWLVEEMQILNPDETLAHIEMTIPVADPEIKRALLDDLRAAGMK